jgi:ketosteroid isomerase-like protein
MMSSSNLDLVRSVYTAWERGDFSSTEWAHPEIEFVIADGPSPGSWTGVAGMAQGFRDFISAWQQYRVEAQEYRELDRERVVTFLRLGGRGKVSGLDLAQLPERAANLFHLRGGKVVRFVMYLDGDRALADLGLKEGPLSQNVEVLRRWIEAFNTRDIEALVALTDQGIELHSVFAAVGGATYDGHDGMRRWHRDLQEAWGEEIHLEPEAYFDLGDGTLSFYVYHGRGRHSGVEVAMPAASVTRWRDGLMTYVKVYLHRADALSDLGVSQGELERIDP